MTGNQHFLVTNLYTLVVNVYTTTQTNVPGFEYNIGDNSDALV